MGAPPMTTSFYLIAEASAKQHGSPLPRGVVTIGDKDHGWHVALNTTNQEIDDIPPFTAALHWNGWPAGFIDPRGGMIAAGEAANEGALIGWLSGLIGEDANAANRASN
jgi:hypothetical protein